MKDLKKRTTRNRKQHFEDLVDDERKQVERLNKLTIEQAYKKETPISKKSGEMIENFDNYPPDKDKLEKFQKELRNIISICDIKPEVMTEVVGDIITSVDAKDLKKLVEVQKAGLKLKRTDGAALEYQLISEKTDVSFQCKDKGNQSPKNIFVAGGSGLPSKDEYVYTIYLRSPEAIIYYLGEVVRAHTLKKGATMIRIEDCDPNSPVPLFHIRTSMAQEEATHVSVDYEGVKYDIPRSLAVDAEDKWGVSTELCKLINSTQHRRWTDGEAKEGPTA
jgi:hypothetical protein